MSPLPTRSISSTLPCAKAVCSSPAHGQQALNIIGKPRGRSARASQTPGAAMPGSSMRSLARDAPP